LMSQRSDVRGFREKTGLTALWRAGTHRELPQAEAE
jgi:hypothetical protein